jgi:hypothetical protein
MAAYWDAKPGTAKLTISSKSQVPILHLKILSTKLIDSNYTRDPFPPHMFFQNTTLTACEISGRIHVSWSMRYPLSRAAGM